MKSKFDVAIIGGGAIGLACAWRLAEAGARVQLFERGKIGQEASRAAAGMLAPQCEAAVHPPTCEAEYSSRAAFFDLCLQSRALYPSFASKLLETSGIDIELSLRPAPANDWREPGILFVPKDESDDCVSDEFLTQRKRGLGVEYSTLGERRALWLPDEGQVENRKLVLALKVACERAGVSIFENTPMTPESARERGENVLMCSGAWNVAGWSTPGAPLVRPVAGEMLAARPAKRIEKIIYSRDVYLVPRRDGRVLIGATMREKGFDKSVSDNAKNTLLQAAGNLIPDAQNWPIEDHWAGLRPASRDGLPILGRIETENVFIAAGHFRNGILLTPITAQLIAECILNNTQPPHDFSFERFESGVLTPCA